MNIERYRYIFMAVVLIVLVQLSDGRPVADKTSPSLVENISPTSAVLTSTVTDIGHLSTAAFLSGFSSSSTVTSTPLSKRSDSDSTVAVSTIVGIVVFMLLFIGIQSLLWSVASREVNIFTTMKCSLRHTCLIAAPHHTARSCMPQTSPRSASPVSDISDASTLCAVPIEEICQPAPVHVQHMSPVHH